MFGQTLSDLLRALADCLQYPVIACLLLLTAAALVLLGSLLAEIFTERRHLKIELPQMADALRRGDQTPQECIAQSGLLKRQKAALMELTNHPELTDNMRQALAERLLEEEQARFERIVKLSDLVCKLGPMFGLLGTLIPLGPGIIALGQGDTYTLSQSLLTAFDTTVAGLAAAAVAMIVSTVRKSWYRNYMSILETLTECVLEVEKNAEKIETPPSV